MALRLQSVDREVKLFLSDLEGPVRRQYLKETAAEIFGEARAHNAALLGYRAREELVTDQTPDKPPEDMAVGGFSTTTFDIAADVIAFTMELARRLSPRSGLNTKSQDETYAFGHIAIVDGAVLEAPYITRGFNEAIIVNARPYARKIERGLSRQRPNGVYEALLLPTVRKRYGNLFNVRFLFRRVPGAAAGRVRVIRRRFNGARAARQPVGSTSQASLARAESYPALLIEPR